MTSYKFARESALDELAAIAERDPVDLRRDLLADSPRTLRALEVATERALGITFAGGPRPWGRMLERLCQPQRAGGRGIA